MRSDRIQVCTFSLPLHPLHRLFSMETESTILLKSRLQNIVVVEL